MKGLYLQKGSVNYWFRFRHNGKQLRFATGQTDEAEAIKVAQELRRNPPIAAVGALLAEVEAFAAGRSDNYKRDSLAVLNSFTRAMDGVEPKSITAARIQTWLDSLEVKDTTKEAYRFQVQKFFEHLITTGKVRRNPAREVSIKVEARSSRKNWVRKAQIEKLIDAAEADPELQYILYCGFHAGLRKDEVIMSRPEWFDFGIGQYGVLHVRFAPDWQPKDGTERTIPLSPEFSAFLQEKYFSLLRLLNGPAAQYMIAPKKVKEKGERYRHDFRTKFETFVGKCEVAFTFHDTRRSFASVLVSAGVSIYKVAKWLGDDVEVVQRTYGHLDPSDNDLARGFTREAAANVVGFTAAAN